MTPLVRIPCILVAMIGLHNSTTPPHAPPGPSENAPSTSLEIILKQRSVTYTFKVIYWSAAFAEIAVILASQKPQLLLSQQVLSSLVCTGSAEKIRLTILFFIGTFAIVLGSYIRWCCYRALGHLFTFEMSIRKNHQLITDGPYSRVRHPAYTGLILAVGGFICWQASPGSWGRECGVVHTTAGKLITYTYLSLVVLVVVGLLRRMSKEDALMKRTFGRQWGEWAARVPYKLIPGIC